MHKCSARMLPKCMTTDEIDETAGNRKMTKKVIEHLDKLNTDCNMTAGLEAKLSLAVGARVMLRRNIDTKAGLVNGAIGTVMSVAAQHVTVQFDNVPAPCKIDKVRSRFMVMKNFYVYRRQFPLILAYAITIHKCQGLSLDCAIVDLSEEVFSDGMVYVALSRGRSLDGLFLTAFDPQSISVSVSSLGEVNRLRKTHRPDLPLYDVPHLSRRKKKLTGLDKTVSPSVKRSRSIPHLQGITRTVLLQVQKHLLLLHFISMMAVWGHTFPSNFLPFPFNFHFHSTAISISDLCACVYATPRVRRGSRIYVHWDYVINPRRACARGLYLVCLSVCLCVCLLRRFLPPRARNRQKVPAKKRHQLVQRYTGIILKNGDFRKSTAF